MTTKQYLQLQDIYAENCDASGNITTVYPALGLGVRGNYEIAILNASALQTDGVDSWMFAIGQDFDADTHILYENTNVSYAASGTSGLFTVTDMRGTRTDDMVEWIGDQEAPTVVGELIGMGVDHNKNKPVALVQWRMFMRNRVDWDSEDEPSVVPNYATTDDLARLVYTKTIIEDDQFVLDEEDGDSIKEIGIEQAPDFAYLTIPAKLDAIKVENEDAYGLIGVSGASGNTSTGVSEPFNAQIVLQRDETSPEGTARYSASGNWLLYTNGQFPTYSDYYNFILSGPENGTVIDGDDEAQWMLKVESKHTSGAEFVEALRYYAPRKTETNNLLIPVSGGEFTGDIYRNEIDENFVYNGAKNDKRYSATFNIVHYINSGYKVYAEKFGLYRTLTMEGFGRSVTMKIGGRIRAYFIPNTLIFTPIPGTENFEWETGDQGLYNRYKFVLEKSGSDYIWKTFIAEAPDFEWVDGDTTEMESHHSVIMPDFDPFKHTPYLHTSGGVIENGIYDGRQAGTPITYYTTDGVVGVSAESPIVTVSNIKYSIIVPSAITVEMNDDIAYLRNAVTEVFGSAKTECDKYLVNNGNGLYTASGDWHGIQYDYSLDTNANGASLAVTYASAGQIYPLATLTGVTEEREKPTYIPYITNGEFNYEDKIQSLTTDTGTLTIYDNPWDNPESIRATVRLTGNRVWEGTLPRATNATYFLSSFVYEGLAIFRIGVSVAANPPNYTIAYDGGGESGDWNIPQSWERSKFIPTSGGTFTGAISASDGNPYTTSGQYEEMIQSRIDNPELAGDNYAASYNMPIEDVFLPFPGSPTFIPEVYGELNNSSLGTIATRELKVTATGVVDWTAKGLGSDEEYKWIHKPVSVNDGAEHAYYITVRLNIVSTDPYELAIDKSLWVLDCWKID